MCVHFLASPVYVYIFNIMDEILIITIQKFNEMETVHDVFLKCLYLCHA
jgi:hypothetical protein